MKYECDLISSLSSCHTLKTYLDKTEMFSLKVGPLKGRDERGEIRKDPLVQKEFWITHKNRKDD